MRRILFCFAILSLAVFLTHTLFADEEIELFSVRKATATGQQKTLTCSVSRERLHSQKNWEPGSGLLSMHPEEAIKAAQEWIAKQPSLARKKGRVIDADMRRCPEPFSSKWCYHVHFSFELDNPDQDPEQWVTSANVVVLFDGSIVEPKQVKPSNPTN